MSAALKILYDFTAEEAGELTVRAGTTVILKGAGGARRAPRAARGAALTPPPPSDDPTEGGSDGWLFVAVAGAPERTGYVPVDYAAPADAPAPAASRWEPAAPALDVSSLAAPPPRATLGAAFAASLHAGASTAGASDNAPDDFAALFASHESWFKGATAKRAELYAALQGDAGDILRLLQESEARSAAVLSRIGELDAIVSEEKARWAERAGH